ncbi:MAG: DUF4870 domain-containing protein [Verrucomicrobiota bacterium]|nr:DUF4870 domain-containing protein [Verrucomicrobiota bacterium]
METLPPNPPPVGIDPSIRTWTVLCHASALAGFFIPAAGHLLGPLFVWLLKRDQAPEIDAAGKESLNFQLSMFLYTAVLGVVCFILLFVLIGILLLPLFAILYVLDTVLVIVASVKASEGTLYRYPLTIRFLS